MSALGERLAAAKKRKKGKGKGLSATKAGIMLHEGTANGQPLSGKQQAFFGWVRGGRRQR